MYSIILYVIGAFEPLHESLSRKVPLSARIHPTSLDPDSARSANQGAGAARIEAGGVEPRAVRPGRPGETTFDRLYRDAPVDPVGRSD